ncbi:MAG: hypothetical protein FWD26_06500 [Treponema sp.]|nr:hypothetical protein [Treponema sp.]
MGTTKIRVFYGLFSLFTLVLGILIYLLFRDLSDFFILKWIPGLDFTKTVFIKLTPSIFSDILKYNIPDMLWFVSGILLLRFIWFYRLKEQKVYVICFYIIGAFFEISQLSDKIPGTFDFMDLLFMGIGAFAEGFMYRRLGNKNRKENGILDEVRK